ncbi:MAG TPA: hypothetical protein VK772_16970 [Puia sp.]|jgi:hypothetical protein|nr:hypothetical protein [Puia sp.]
MKKIYIFLFGIFLMETASAQKNFNDSIADSRNRITETAMLTLGGWAAANIAAGFIIAGQTQGQTKYVWQMNAYWNLVNGGLAVMGYIRARKAMSLKYGFSENESEQISIEKLYALNFGLDLAYIATGFFLHEKGMHESNLKSHDQLMGYGTSLVIQGGFLLLMDGIVLSLHHKNSVRLNKKLKSLELGAGPNGLGLSYKF